MGTIYIVTAGTYSDYHIVAATTDKAKAEEILRFTKAASWSEDDVYLETYEDSACAKETDVYMSVFDEDNPDRNRTVKFMPLIDSDYHYQEVLEAGFNTVIELVYPYDYAVKVHATSEEHAKKIACDIMARYKAEREGIL